MLEVADILRAAGPESCARLARLPSQRRALRDILQCRTAQRGGQVYGCVDCGQLHFSYHSCGNRHCPKCHGQRSQKWLERQKARLLPCPYYFLTFTLPGPLRDLAYSHQKVLYGLLLNATAASIQKLCDDPKWLGAQVSSLGVVHTWTRALLYHPHAHFLVSAGGLSRDGQRWVSAKNPQFLVPVRALSVIYRAKIREGLQAAGLLEMVPPQVWKQKWVVHAKPAGRGDKVLEYLGRYVFRIAITHSRLEKLENGHITFRYRDNQTQQINHVRLSVEEFVKRFVHHVLPKGFAKVRHFGLAGAACAKRLAAALALLQILFPTLGAEQPRSISKPGPILRCPSCGSDRLVFFGEFPTLRLRPANLEFLIDHLTDLLRPQKIPP